VLSTTGRIKVKVRNKAKICTNFPDDTIWSNDEIVSLGGKNITVAIGEILTRLGAEISEPILEDNGWALNISYKGREPWCLVHDGGDLIYFYMEDRWGPLFNDKPQYIELIVLLNAELHRDPRFRNIQWYRRRDLNKRGPTSASPVDP
jgi:hypothetical protein